MFLVAARASAAAVAHPDLCNSVVVVPPAEATSGALPLEDIVIPLPPADAEGSDLFHERCISAMEAASDVWRLGHRLGDYINQSLVAENVHKSCTGQVPFHLSLCVWGTDMIA